MSASRRHRLQPPAVSPRGRPRNVLDLHVNHKGDNGRVTSGCLSRPSSNHHMRPVAEHSASGSSSYTEPSNPMQRGVGSAPGPAGGLPTIVSSFRPVPHRTRAARRTIMDAFGAGQPFMALVDDDSHSGPADDPDASRPWRAVGELARRRSHGDNRDRQAARQ